MKDVLKRYGISTIGLVLAAFGVGLSIKSNLGIAPLSCIPTVLGLEFPTISVGTFTWGFNLLFIIFQAMILGKDFSLKNGLLQVIPLLLFGYLIDLFIWLLGALDAPLTNYFMQLLFCLLAILITAIGIKVEIAGGGWMLPVDCAINAACTKWGYRFGTVKVAVDVTIVILTIVLCLVFWGLFTGNGTTVAVREGTVLQAVLTGLCMRVTDPLLDRFLFNK